MSFKHSLAVLGLGASLASCARYDEPRMAPLVAPSSAEAEMLSIRGRDWGLALSGGGLRSALFNIGVMKALYDANRLEDIDLLSTVSGGSYAGYWLLGNRLRDEEPGTRLGEPLLSPVNFPKTVCDLVTRANFVTDAQGALAFVRGTSVSLYDRAIGRTFGRSDPRASLRFADLVAPTRVGRIPYWIVNASITGPASSPAEARLFEFTPLRVGNPAAGQGIWPDWSFTVRQAVTISGAALSPLRQRVFDPSPGAWNGRIWLWDGGRTENLGAIALVRRGVSNIIIVDAEHDPSYAFGALRILDSQIGRAGGRISIAGNFDPRIRPTNPNLEAAVVSGAISFPGNGPAQRFHYVKMALPQSVATSIDDPARLAAGKDMDNRFYAALRAPGGRWDCDRVDGLNGEFRNWAAYVVGGYSRYMSGRNYTRFFRNFRWQAARFNYPQYSTFDQSFYTDQALAFIGLGYLEGLELVHALGAGHNR